eukprot:COSAG06_NODE_2247_length_7259_cov_24.660506_5_plen_101_part_00
MIILAKSESMYENDQNLRFAPAHGAEIRYARVDVTTEDQHPHVGDQVLLVGWRVAGHCLGVIEERLASTLGPDRGALLRNVYFIPIPSRGPILAKPTLFS